MPNMNDWRSMTDMVDVTRTIYNHLQDEESKHIFENRLLYTLTGDGRYIRRMLSQLPAKHELDQAAAFCRTHLNEVVFYGAGNDLKLLTELYPDLDISCICDGSRKKQQEGWRGIPVISPDELIEQRDHVYVAITTSGFYREIRKFLEEHGFRQDQIINLSMVTDIEKQYFDPGIMVPGSGEVFVDGGCFNCSTDREFIRWCSGDYKKIYAYEPDRRNYENCLELCRKEQIERIEIFNKGLWDCAAELSFRETGGQGSAIEEGTGMTCISTTSIDETAGGENVTFIKLDVEGAERKALQGARKTIKRDRPRLAVSVYHKAEDIIELPAYILSLHEDYRLYLRHYQMSPCETIVYAL